MTLEQRFATEYRETATDRPGVVVTDNGDTLVVLPDGSREALPCGGAATIPGPLPDFSTATPGDVLTFDEDAGPVWSTPAWNQPPSWAAAPRIGVVSQVAGGTPAADDWIGLVDLGSIVGPDPDGAGTSFAFEWQSSTDGGTTWTPVASHSTDPSIQVTVTTQYRLQVTATNGRGTAVALSDVVTIA